MLHKITLVVTMLMKLSVMIQEYTNKMQEGEVEEILGDILGGGDRQEDEREL